MDKLALKRYVEDNSRLIARRETSYPGLYVLKYKNRVFFEGLWNQFTEECRGTVVDADYNVVSRPFTKIYNYGIEAKAPRLAGDTMLDVYRKINGFMVAVTWHNDDILVSTTGSTDSPFVAMAREFIDRVPSTFRSVCRDYPNLTFMFESVHPNDPHIIPEQSGMYLLGYRENSWTSSTRPDPAMLKTFSVLFDTLPVEYQRMTLDELRTQVKTVRHEGFVFYTDTGVSAKIKSPYYLVNKFVARNPRTDKLMRTDIKQTIDEEYYPLIDHIQANIVEYTALTEQERLAWVRKFLEK